MNNLDKLNEVLKGGKGSGFHGHSGVKGKRGGSAPGKGGGGNSMSDKALQKLSGMGFTEDVGGSSAKKITSPDGRYVNISVTKLNDNKLHVDVTMRKSDSTKIVERGGPFFASTGVEAISELTGGGDKFPSVAKVRNFGGF